MANLLEPSIHHLQDLAIRSGEAGLPNAIKEKYDEAMIGTGKKLWQGMLAVAASGFGKGVLASIGIIAAVSALLIGFQASIPGGLEIGDQVIDTFAEGATAGIAKAFYLMTHPIGLVALAVGGAIGAVGDVRKAQNKITAEMARAEEQYYERARQMQQAREMDAALPQPSWEEPQATEPGFAEQERQRRLIEYTAGRTVV